MGTILVDDTVLELGHTTAWRPGEASRREPPQAATRKLRIIGIDENELRLRKATCDSLLDAGHLAVASLDGDRITWASEGMRNLLGIRAMDAREGVFLRRYLHPDDQERVVDAFLQAQSRRRELALHCRLAGRGTGAPVHLVGCPAPIGSGGAPAYSLMALGSREDLRGFAHGIPDVPEPAASALRTRSGTLLERAAAMLHDAWTRTESIAVMSIAIESATGPLAPLQQSKLESRAIDRLRQCLRDGDAIGRQGESGLLAVIGGAKTSYAAAIVAGRLIEQLKDPIHVDGVATPVRMNIGIAVYPYDDHQLGGLLEHARFARATAQGAGPNRFSLAETSLNRSVASDPIEWDERLRLGSPELDAQHLEMVWLLGELQHDAMSVAALAGLEEKFETLLRCLQADFVAEERMMTGLPTSRSEAHRSEHRRILHKLACLRHADLAQSTALRVRVLSEWFTAHIPDFDAEMLGGG